MDALLAQFKDQYPNVFLVSVKDNEYVCRELTRKEYKRTMAEYPNNEEFEEEVCRIATLYPAGYDFSQTGSAGLARTLAMEIVTLSGFASHEQHVEMLDYYREDMQNLDAQAETVIQLVFPAVREEEMENWTQEQLMRKLARAEWVMREIWNMKDKSFTAQGEVKEGEPQPAPPTLQEIGEGLREQGLDPMVVLRDSIVKRPDANYVDFPLIGGTKLLKNEEVLSRVREQIQRVPERQSDLLPSIPEE